MNPSPLTPLEKERLIKEFSETFPSAPFLATESKIFSWFISKIEEQKEDAANLRDYDDSRNQLLKAAEDVIEIRKGYDNGTRTIHELDSALTHYIKLKDRAE